MTIALDKEGFLKDRAQWNEQVARELAARSGIDLTPAHWEVIGVAREFYAATGVSLEMRPLVKLLRERIGPKAGNSIYLLQLFPGNPAKVVAKVGGLPRPTNCL